MAIPVNKYYKKKQTLKKTPNIIRSAWCFRNKSNLQQTIFGKRDSNQQSIRVPIYVYRTYTRLRLTRWHLKNNRKCSVLGTCSVTPIFFRNADNAPNQDENVDLPTHARVLSYDMIVTTSRPETLREKKILNYINCCHKKCEIYYKLGTNKFNNPFINNL